MTPTIRMLVLETDEPHPKTKASKGSFGAMFDNLFKEAGKIHDPPLTVETEMRYVVEDPPKHKGHVPTTSEIPEDISAILITGSMYDAHGDNPWILKLIELLQQLWRERPNLRFSGVCFGHQILCRMLGAQVEPHPRGDWELAHTELDLTDRGKELFRTDRPSIQLHQMHQDHVTTVPSHESTDLLTPQDRVHVWATTNHTQIQGMYLRDRLFTSQGHLGFDEKVVREQVNMRIENGGIKDSRFAEERKDTAALKHDGVMVARAILRFFHGEDRDIE
ncbi:hypothetical protein LTS07_005984 [Exophiala sideris]|uniref:Glutamine amidotransferase domain-containing protein n=1 Tax=Exophiala sideris TaxID=1016849 RepID=A0ABR0J7R9_9EURO|nr:hypothetical protein LTS07_005984 [Exophiala sideris]KAK5058151.1 hypothetical protein LTR69_007148 [Exophiala sideris]KAK5182111.1 hypothetical protein LTR44_005712 [Eurotiomycetes sp. CCFEE 6388]